jgi:integrase
MSFRMVTPRRSKSGSVKARKVIPRDVREDYARLYGVSSEAKLTVPAGTPVHEAKIRASEFLADVETRIATIRAAQKGEGQSLSQRQAFALAGEWYVWYVGRHEENPGTLKQWNDLWVALIERLEDHAPEYVLEHGWRDLDWTREPQVLEGIRPQIADEAKTAQFLALQGVVLNSEAQALFLDCVLPEFIAAILRLERVASGNYEADERPSQFAKYDGRTVRPSTGTTPWALFEAWATATQPADATVNRWRSVFLDLDKRFASASDISEDDAREWARKLVTPKRGQRTVNDVWITAARTVFGWARGERMIPANPFENVRVTEPRRVRHRESQAFTVEEAATILRASSAIGEPRTTIEGAFRWVPWLCAYSGARAGEITQLRGEDIQRRGDVHAMLITPAAGTVKTGKARAVPIHEHLIEQGFLEFVRSRGKGPLFYDPAEENGPSDPLNPRRAPAVVVRQKVAAWVRGLGIADDELSPTHAWRHTFKQIADRAGISERTSDHITGHSHRTEGARYGAPTLEGMAEALGKFPRYDLAFGQENGGQNRGK